MVVHKIKITPDWVHTHLISALTLQVQVDTRPVEYIDFVCGDMSSYHSKNSLYLTTSKHYLQ